MSPAPLHPHPFLDIRTVPGKGRGVFTRQPLAAGTLIEATPVLVLSPSDVVRLRDTVLDHYLFQWQTDDLPDPPVAPPVCALALGYLSLINHAHPANATFVPDHAGLLIRVYAADDLDAGDEITIDYGIPLWFDLA